MGSKRSSQAEILQVRHILATVYPDCFSEKGRRKRPLKIGIHKDIRTDIRDKAPGISCRMLRNAIRDYVSGPTYLKSIVAGATRIGIDGSESGLVTDDQAAHAERMLASLKTARSGGRGHFKGKGEKKRRAAA